MKKLRPLSLPVLLIAAALLLAGVIWANYRVASLYPRNDHFVVYWVSLRAWLITGQSPYADAVSAEISRQVYGEIPQEGEWPLRPSYPLWAGLILLPFALVSDALWAQALWITFLQAASVFNLALLLAVTRWRPRRPLILLLALFFLFSFPALWPLFNGSLIILSALSFTAALAALSGQRDELAGLLLVLALAHPAPFILAVGLVLLWSLSHRRWIVAAWFFAMAAALAVLGMFVIPDWPMQALRVLLNYPEYPPPQTVQDALRGWLPGLGRQLGLAVTLLLSGILALEWWLSLRNGFRHLLWAAALTLVLSAWIGLPFAPANHYALFYPLLLVFARLDERSRRAGFWFAAVLLMGFFFGLWVLNLRAAPDLTWPGLPAALLFPLPALAAASLIWVRWWAIREPRLFADEMRAHVDG